MRYPEKQRELLLKAWNRGYLSDTKSYGMVSEVTGLSRKQVSNWARYQIKKLGNKPRPRKSNIPLSSIFKNLPLKCEELESCVVPKESPAFYATLPTNAAFARLPGNFVNIQSHEKPINEETVSQQSMFAQELPKLPEYLLHKPKLPSTCITKPATYEDITGAWLPKISPMAANLCRSYNSVLERNHFVADAEKSPPNIVRLSCRLSPVSQLLLQNAVKDVRELHDGDLEDLGRMTRARSIDIRCYLLIANWKVKPAVRGVRYITP